MPDDPSQRSGDFLLYLTEDGRLRIECRQNQETLWLSWNQIAALFDRDKSVISKHLKNIFEEGEIICDSVVAQHATTAADGKTYQEEYFRLEAVLAHFSGNVPRKSEVTIGKNYLNAEELETLNRIVTAYLEFAELRAKRREPMRMVDWISKLDDFLRLSEYEVLTRAGNISAEQARLKAEAEYQQYRKLIDAQPSEVDRHLADALRKLDQIEKHPKS